jgi:hypothetical protein
MRRAGDHGDASGRQSWMTGFHLSSFTYKFMRMRRHFARAHPHIAYLGSIRATTTARDLPAPHADDLLK